MRIRPLHLIYGIITLLAVSAGLFLLLRKADLSERNDLCALQVETALTEAGITAEASASEQLTVKTFRAISRPWRKEFQVPLAADLEQLLKSIADSPYIKDFTLSRITRKRTKQQITATLEFAEKNITLYYLALQQPLPQGKLAIVLDDWGYSKQVFEDSLALPQEVTYAILPNLPHSREIAQRLDRIQREFILHLPMEPHNAEKIKLEQDTLMTGMAPDRISEIIIQDIAGMPQLSGINNHMGSCATEDAQVMAAVIREVKKQNLYFLDSVTGKSVCRDVATEYGIPFLKRDIFLDNENSREAIIAQLKEAVTVARQNGTAIAIGHARPLTVSVLKEQLPELAREGILLVRASRLLSASRSKDGN